MEDKYALISTLVAAIVLAFVFGFIASRIRLSPIVGYLADHATSQSQNAFTIHYPPPSSGK